MFVCDIVGVLLGMFFLGWFNHRERSKGFHFIFLEPHSGSGIRGFVCEGMRVSGEDDDGEESVWRRIKRRGKSGERSNAPLRIVEGEVGCVCG